MGLLSETGKKTQTTQVDQLDFFVQSKIVFADKAQLESDHKRCDKMIDQLKEQIHDLK